MNKTESESDLAGSGFFFFLNSESQDPDPQPCLKAKGGIAIDLSKGIAHKVDSRILVYRPSDILALWVLLFTLWYGPLYGMAPFMVWPPLPHPGHQGTLYTLHQ